MSRNKKSTNDYNSIKNLRKKLDYLISLEKEYKRSTQDNTTIQYTVNEGDMGSVKIIDVTPVSLKNNSSFA